MTQRSLGQHGTSASQSVQYVGNPQRRLSGRQRLLLAGKAGVEIAVSITPYIVVATVLLLIIMPNSKDGDWKIYLLSAMADACNSFESSVSCLMVAVRLSESRYVASGANSFCQLLANLVPWAKSWCLASFVIGLLLLFLGWLGYAGENSMLLKASAAAGLFCRLFAVVLEARVELLISFVDEGYPLPSSVAILGRMA